MSGHDTPPKPLVEEDHGPPPGTPKPLDLEALAPTFASSYGSEHLASDEERELVSLAQLPGWDPNGREPPAFFGSATAPDGHGLGAHFSDAMGHGLRPGEMLAIGAASAGAGKTAFLMQLVDGLALRNVDVFKGRSAWGSVLTPVLVASEMGIDALTWRSLARWTGHSASIFRGGRTVLNHGTPRQKDEARAAWTAAQSALFPSSPLGLSRKWLRLMSAAHVGSLLEGGPQAFVSELERIVEAWREQLAKDTKKDVVPIVVLDPLQRYQGGDEAIDALSALSRALCTSTVEKKWITLLTSDTNKASAKGDNAKDATDAEQATAVFRGSYNLMHEVTAAVALRTSKTLFPSEDEKKRGVRVVEAVFAKQRWGSAAQPGPHFVFDGPTLRFFPMTREETEKRLREAADRAEEAKRVNVRAPKTIPMPSDFK
jgi:hypothetical protein